MKKILVLASLLACSSALAQKPFRIKTATVMDNRIRLYNDASFAKSFNVQEIEKAYPYIELKPVRSVPTNEILKSTCKEAVLKILKAPASAKFPKFSDASYSVPGGIYFLQGDVDSQNSYGALLRSPFSCSIAFEGNNKGGMLYTLADLYEK